MRSPDRGTAFNRRALGVLALGHMCCDMCQGAVPALLPFLITQRGYSYTAATSLVLAVTLGSSLIQPVFGYYADRRSLPWLLPVAVATSGLGIALAGPAPGYLLALVAIAVAGLGVGGYHPEAARFANYASGYARGAGMSLFAIGGNAGFAIGPIIVTVLVLRLGLAGMLLFAALPVVIAAVIAREMPQLLRMRARAHLQEGSAFRETEAQDAWSPFIRLTGMAVFRSGVYYGLQSFIPAYFIARLGASPTLANLALTIMLVSGVVGNLVGGRLADVIDRRVVVAGAMAVLPFLIWGLLRATVTSGLVLLALVGFAAIGSSTVTVVLGQEYLPRQLGVASGITLGLSIGLGGLTAAALGVVADRAGLVPVLWTIAALPIPAFILALTLPRVHAMRRGGGDRKSGIRRLT